MSRIKLDVIADIIPPEMPTTSLGSVWAVVILVSIVITLIVYYRFNSRERVLRRLIKKYQYKKLNQRQLSFLLAQLLGDEKKDFSDNTLWQEFVTQLQAARFSRDGLDDAEFEKMLNRVRQWI